MYVHTSCIYIYTDINKYESIHCVLPKHCITLEDEGVAIFFRRLGMRVLAGVEVIFRMARTGSQPKNSKDLWNFSSFLVGWDPVLAVFLDYQLCFESDLWILFQVDFFGITKPDSKHSW